MRLICVSKMLAGSIPGSPSHWMNRVFAWRFAWRTAAQNALSSASGFSFSNCARSVIQPSPMASVMTDASDGLASISQRRGVTAVGFVVEALWEHGREIRHDALLEQFLMQRGDAVGAV